MGMGGEHTAAKQGGGTRKLVSEINITPLVDTLLVLLIIFMVCAPAMTRTVGIELPEADSSRADRMEADIEKQFLMIGLANPDKVIHEKISYIQDEFFNQFPTLTAGLEPEKVFLQADKLVPYERLIQMMVFLQNQGHEKIGLVFQDN